MDLRYYRIVGRNKIAITWQHRTHHRHYVVQLVRVADNFPLSQAVREAYRDQGLLAAIAQLRKERNCDIAEACDLWFQYAGRYTHSPKTQPAGCNASEVNNG